ncbi:ABC-type nitrate/sulfonate/bicarbonate transport system permease component [Amycolatopsis bartoniae]|uniref:Nitrate ABC transporter permease n=1 Tax=Amycolatopsis bartoniae TaxID=941986 RepID=A0A8H9IQ35_9PSEU|nr:ABC transporter permease [Amycolatopsis bartoniae]MBB2939894.1 ABC-type nitrate/sulfonate/bicarbonate transport system permease component [Amycolatopsis bartoniae]TVT08319.1 ABC transporter permease [Amycolatopsis bartoniae]GHF35821.1 nitrate ABC transporter permease [Amycolatopsis bartoniae]
MIRSRLARLGRLAAWEFTLPVVLVLVWWWSSQHTTSYFFPPLSIILERFHEVWLFDRFASDFLPSLGNLLGGYLVAVLAGVALGVLLGLTRWIRETVNPVLQFLRALPATALLPLAIGLLGIGSSMKVAVIFLGALWPILLNTIDGVRGIDPTVWDVARSYRVSWRHRIAHIVLPGAAPQIFVGLRASLSVAVILLLASELYGSSSGVGHFILQAQRQFAIGDMWAGMVLLGILGYLLNLALQLVDRKVLAWRHSLTRKDRSE